MIIAAPYLNSVQLQYGTLSGNTYGESTFSGTNVVFVGGSNVTLQGSSDSLYIHGAAGGTGGGSGDGGVFASAGTSSMSTGTLKFVNSGGVSFGLSNGSLTASVKTDYQTSGAYLTTAQPPGAYLTTAMASNASSAFAGTGTSATNASVTLNTAGLAISVAAPAAGGIAGVAASNSTQTSGTVVLANSNGISWSSGTQGIFGTVATNYQSQGAYLTTAALSGDSSKYAGTSTGMAGGSVTLNTAGISLSLPAYLTTAALSGATSNYAGTSTGMAGGSVTLNTAGISLSLPAYLTTADLSANSSKYAGTSTGFAGGSVTLNTAGISISLPAYLTTADLSANSSKYAGTSTGIAGGSVTLNTAGISISLPAYLTTAALSQNTSNYAGINTGATGGIGLTANTSGVSVSLPSLSEFNPYPGTGFISGSSLGAQTLYFVPFDITGNQLSAYRLNLYLNLLTTYQASNSTGSAGYTISAALYSKPTNSTDRIATFWSMSAPWKITLSSNTQLYASNLVGISNSTQVSTVGTSISNANASTYLANSMAGFRVVPLPVSSTLTQGRYWLAVANSSASANVVGVLGGNVLMQTVANVLFAPVGTSSQASNANNAWSPAYPGGGTYSAVSAAFPASVPLTSDSIRGGGTLTFPFFNFSAYTTSVGSI